MLWDTHLMWLKCLQLPPQPTSLPPKKKKKQIHGAEFPTLTKHKTADIFLSTTEVLCRPKNKPRFFCLHVARKVPPLFVMPLRARISWCAINADCFPVNIYDRSFGLQHAVILGVCSSSTLHGSLKWSLWVCSEGVMQYTSKSNHFLNSSVV